MTEAAEKRGRLFESRSTSLDDSCRFEARVDPRDRTLGVAVGVVDSGPEGDLASGAQVLGFGVV